VLAHNVSAFMTAEDLDALRALARADDRTVSAVIRFAVREYLKQNGPADQGEPAVTTTSVTALGHVGE
jgi:hypothetical protein